jgi:RNA polymerase sigma-70 factor (ECF subfamily)
MGVADSSRTILRSLLVADYSDLSRRLTRRLGSSDLAYEALQETYLRLDRTAKLGPVRSPKSYLWRIAVNIAADRRRSEARRLTAGEVDSLLEIADESPDPGQAAEARSEIEALKRAIAELPPRRRAIFLAVRVDEVSTRELAERFGVTKRTIEIELKQAVEHCAFRLKRDRNLGFASGSRKTSMD